MGWLFYMTLAALAFALIELAVRWCKLADYILYTRSDRFGFAPKPNSSGTMRGSYRWRINSRGERSDSEADVEADSIVLVGDSIVEGGSFVDQSQTLGQLTAAATDRPVHPVAAGGWTLPNELQFIAANAHLLTAGTFVFVSNSNDLDKMNDQVSRITHPTDRPALHSVFLLCRFGFAIWYALRRALHRAQPELELDPAWQVSLAAFLQRYDGRLIWVLYPSRNELADRIAPCAPLERLVSGHAEMIDLSQVQEWTPACYLDELHPSSEGRRVLAATLALAIMRQDRNDRLGSGG